MATQKNPPALIIQNPNSTPYYFETNSAKTLLNPRSTLQFIFEMTLKIDQKNATTNTTNKSNDVPEKIADAIKHHYAERTAQAEKGIAPPPACPVIPAAALNRITWSDAIRITKNKPSGYWNATVALSVTPPIPSDPDTKQKLQAVTAAINNFLYPSDQTFSYMPELSVVSPPQVQVVYETKSLHPAIFDPMF